MFAFHFFYQSRKLIRCGGMLPNGYSAPSHVIAGEASCYFPHSMVVPNSFRNILAKFSTTFPFQRYKSRGELLELTQVRSCSSGSHLSKLHNNFVPGKELFNIIKSACYEIEGPNHCWLNSVCNAYKFLHHGDFLVLVNAYIHDDSLNDHHDHILMIEGVKFLQKRYPKLDVIGLQCVSSATSVMINSKMLKTIMEEYITFPVLLLDRNLIKVADSAVYLFFEGSTCHPFVIKPGAELRSLQIAIEKHISNQKLDMLEESNVHKPNEYVTIEEPNAASIFRNLLLSYAGTLSVDEDGGRIFLSDSNHHRIIIVDGDGKILDSIGSSPGFLDADFEVTKLSRPAASFYNVSDGCLYFVDSENNAIRRADMKRRVVETMYPVPQSSSTWSRNFALWSWILKFFGLAKDNEKTRELEFEPIASSWHMLNLVDNELIIISRSFAVAWIMCMTTWKIKEVIRGIQNIFECYGNLIVDKLSFLKDAYGVLPQKFNSQIPSEKILYALLSSVGNFGDDIFIYDAVGQRLLKYNRESKAISHIHFSNVGLLGIPYWLNCHVERVFNSSHCFEHSNDHVHNFNVLPGRCDITVNVKIPEDTILAAPLDDKCIWRQARGSAAEVSGLGEENKPGEKIGIAQQWYDELDNLAFTNPELESLESSGKVNGKTTNTSFQDTENVQFNCVVNVSPGTSEVIVSAALYLKPNPALNIMEAASLVNSQKHECGMMENECLSLFLKKHGTISDIIFTKPLHLRIKLDCGDHPTALTTKESILTDTRLEFNVIFE